jgi:hypothetical protein
MAAQYMISHPDEFMPFVDVEDGEVTPGMPHIIHDLVILEFREISRILQHCC